jgi:hypothetical protein
MLAELVGADWLMMQRRSFPLAVTYYLARVRNRDKYTSRDYISGYPATASDEESSEMVVLTFRHAPIEYD